MVDGRPTWNYGPERKIIEDRQGSLTYFGNALMRMKKLLALEGLTVDGHS